MSLDKAIEHNKEHRKPYRGSASFDPHCRNHNACGYCENNRLHNFRKELLRIKQQIMDYINESQSS